MVFGMRFGMTRADKCQKLLLRFQGNCSCIPSNLLVVKTVISVEFCSSAEFSIILQYKWSEHIICISLIFFDAIINFKILYANAKLLHHCILKHVYLEKCVTIPKFQSVCHFFIVIYCLYYIYKGEYTLFLQQKWKILIPKYSVQSKKI